MSEMSYWAQALQKLTDKEREILRNSVQQPSETFLGLGAVTIPASFHTHWPQRILELCKKRQADEQSRQWKFRLAGRDIRMGAMLDNIVRLLEKIKVVGDVAVNADPLHAGLPWAAMRLLLTVSETTSLIERYLIR